MASTLATRQKLRRAGQSATVAAPAAATAAASVGVPTKVEFDKVVADNVALRATVAALLVALKSAGIVA